MIFESAVQGKTDREIAIILNSLGYKTTGTHGPQPFSKDTIKNMLKNKFYIGLVRDGKGGWLKAKHEPFINPELFEEAQKIRDRRITSRGTIRSDATIYSLTGITRCVECGSTLRSFTSRGKTRLVCNGRLNRGDCNQSSSFLEMYEKQLREYLSVFNIPEDYQERILAEQKKLLEAYDIDEQRSTLETQLKRLDELYQWGRKTRSEYLADSNAIKRQLQRFKPTDVNILQKLASFLKDITQAWDQASQLQRNHLLKYLLESVWIKDKKVVAVTPQPEFVPFFDLQYDGKSNYTLAVRPRGDSNPRSPP
ncbi:recombinase family protein [Chloroflexota bacterium]